MEDPDVPDGLKTALACEQIDKCELSKITYSTGHETIIAGGLSDGMARWREGLFALMHRLALASAYFNIPAEQVMEIGVEFKI